MKKTIYIILSLFCLLYCAGCMATMEMWNTFGTRSSKPTGPGGILANRNTKGDLIVNYKKETETCFLFSSAVTTQDSHIVVSHESILKEYSYTPGANWKRWSTYECYKTNNSLPLLIQHTELYYKDKVEVFPPFECIIWTEGRAHWYLPTSTNAYEYKSIELDLIKDERTPLWAYPSRILLTPPTLAFDAVSLPILVVYIALGSESNNETTGPNKAKEGIGD